jgi:hypothetical protein
MLIQKQIKDNDIVTIKLLTGEEVVAKITDVTADGFVMHKPAIINIGTDKAGNVGLQMVPYFLLSAEPEVRIPIKNQHVITMVLAADQIKSNYIKSTTGISLATNSNGLLT